MCSKKDQITSFALGFGVAVPFLYYGVQLVASPFFPGFSLMGTTASELGSEHSTRPWVFNAGVILTGVAALVASVGFWRALRELGARSVLVWLTPLLIALTGLSSLWAGIFPLPDRRHSGLPVLLVAMLLLPIVLTAASWTLGISRALKTYFVATIGLLLLMVPVMSGMTRLDGRAHRGLIQRVFALTIFPPIGVASGVLASRTRYRLVIPDNSDRDGR